jgi:nanoRNase/pAp phosphatase (c-di-AMP/oligoRNAs hydrolase)
VEHLEIIAEMADLIVRTEGVKWVLSLGEFVGDVYFSLRTKKRRGSADRIAQKLVAGLGTGGGHEMLAGGKVPADEKPHHSHQELTEILVARFLKAIKRKDLKAENLLSYSRQTAVPRKPEAGETPVDEKKVGG